DPLILRVFRMQDKIVEPCVRAGVDLGNSADRLRIEYAIANDAKPARSPFAHQNITARQKYHPEGTVETLRDYRDFNLVLLGCIENEGTIAQRTARQIDYVGLPVEDAGEDD